MTSLFSPKIPRDILNNYFSVLEETGHVKHVVSFNLLAYVFLLDMVNNCSRYITKEDYNIIRKCLRLLFKNGDCLFQYPTFCQNRIVIGKDNYMGDVSFSLNEKDAIQPTEDDLLFLNEDLTEE